MSITTDSRPTGARISCTRCAPLLVAIIGLSLGVSARSDESTSAPSVPSGKAARDADGGRSGGAPSGDRSRRSRRKPRPDGQAPAELSPSKSDAKSDAKSGADSDIKSDAKQSTPSDDSPSGDSPRGTKQPSDASVAPKSAGSALAPRAKHPKSEKLRFQFRFQPWKDVLDWFADQADLSLVMDAPPQGTFNYSDSRDYTPAEAIDLLNSVLLTKGYTLIRRDRMLMLINLEDGIPPNLISTVPVDSLDTKGDFELVSVLFNLEKLRPEEAEVEIKKLIGPQGSAVALTKSRQILVTETVGRLKAIRSVLMRIEKPEGAGSGLQIIELKIARSEDVLPVVRQLLEIPEDKSVAVDGSIRVASEAGSNRLVVSGRPEKVARAVEVIKGLDVSEPGANPAGRAASSPQLEVYSIGASDPQAVLAIIQTMLAGQSEVRLTIDPKTNSLVAMARPSQHATIRATLAQLQREGQHVEVIRLSRVDPQTAVLSINKLFSDAKGNAPQVDADPTTRQLMIRGTEAQILQIRGLLEKMGESLGSATTGQGGRMRTVPMSPEMARSVLEQAEQLWPTMRTNKIRVVRPSTTRPEGGSSDGALAPPSTQLREIKPSHDSPPAIKPPAELPTPPATKPPASNEKPADPPRPVAERRSPAMPGGARIWFVADEKPASIAPAAKEPPPIVVVPGPDGLIITSDDPEALDEFERLLTKLSEAPAAVGPDVTVFYLKHAKAQAIAETLDLIIAGGTVNSTPSGGSDTAGAASAPPRLGAGRRPLITGAVKITPDQRLNALLVQANRADVDSIEQLLKILDQKESPEDISVAPKPRMIPVLHSRAQEIADILKQVYADRMIENPAAAPGRQPFMLPFMMGGMRGQQQPQPKRDDVAKVSIGVDTRTNTLIVAATDPMFEEVKQLVEQLDVAAGDQDQTVRVVTLHHTSSSAIERALTAIAGDKVEMKNGGQASADQGAQQGYQPPWQNRNGRRTRGGQGGQFGQGGQGGNPAFNGPGQPQMGQPGQPNFGGGGRRYRGGQSGAGPYQ